MNVTVPVILSLILGWLATLTLQSAKTDVSILDFLIAICGAGVAAALGAFWLEIPVTGIHGVTLSGIALLYAGALVVLAVANMLRRGRPLRRQLRYSAYVIAQSRLAAGSKVPGHNGPTRAA